MYLPQLVHEIFPERWAPVAQELGTYAQLGRARSVGETPGTLGFGQQLAEAPPVAEDDVAQDQECPRVARASL
jgi:hypothetical protein